MKFKLIVIINLLWLTSSYAKSQSFWITYPEKKSTSSGIYHFRKNFMLKAIPASFTINVGANENYRLYVNGIPLAPVKRPAMQSNSSYQTINIANFLMEGNNTIAAVLWDSTQPALGIQGKGDLEKVVNTDSSWKVMKNTAYNLSDSINQLNGAAYPWNWEETAYQDSSWKYASNKASWDFVSDINATLSEEKLLRFENLTSSSGIKVNTSFIKGKRAVKIPAHDNFSIVVEAPDVGIDYPEVIVSEGKGATIKIIRMDNPSAKKESYDLFIPDGGENRKFRPLLARTYRYLQLEVITQDEPLILNDLYTMIIPKQ